MREFNLRAFLEITTNIAVLSVSVLVLSVFSLSYFGRKSKPQFESGLQKGKTFAQLPEVDYSSSPKTLLIALSSKCGYCEESIPFYKQVAEAERENKTTHVLAISTETADVMKRYLSQNQLSIDAVPVIDFNTYNISATPTLILVDSNGVILNFWVGKLSQEAEQEVIKTIAAS